MANSTWENYKATAQTCLVVTIAILLYDVFLAFQDKTISATTLFMSQHGHFTVPLLVGLLCAHLFTPWKTKSTLLSIIWVPAVIALIAADILYTKYSITGWPIDVMSQYPLIPFFCGFPLGWCFQQKKKV